MKISIIISSFKEPKLERAIKAALNQNTKIDYDVIVSAPDKPAEDLVKKYRKKGKKIKFIKDPGKGKSFGLNIVFQKLKSDIWIFTDADIYLDKNVVSSVSKSFEDKKVGCICGRIIPENSKKTMLGFWAHLLADAGAHMIRKKLSNQDKFLECSGYLFAFRKGLISKIPLNVAEDSHIPYEIYKQGYKIKYTPKAIVYVKNPLTLKDFIIQRVRTAKAHTSLTDYHPDFPKVKTFKNEIKEGTWSALKYPSNLKEFIWTIELFFVRFYIWMKVFYDEKFKKKVYSDGWERSETTKI